MHQAILLLKKIPKGRVVTYKELARACNTSPRAIGQVMAGNKDPAHFPCYKVVSSSGELRGYSAPGGIPRKYQLLRRDGVTFDKQGRVEKRHFYFFSAQ